MPESSQFRAQPAATRASKEGPNPSSAGMSSVVAGGRSARSETISMSSSSEEVSEEPLLLAAAAFAAEAFFAFFGAAAPAPVLRGSTAARLPDLAIHSGRVRGWCRRLALGRRRTGRLPRHEAPRYDRRPDRKSALESEVETQGRGQDQMLGDGQLRKLWAQVIVMSVEPNDACEQVESGLRVGLTVGLYESQAVIFESVLDFLVDARHDEVRGGRE